MRSGVLRIGFKHWIIARQHFYQHVYRCSSGHPRLHVVHVPDAVETNGTSRHWMCRTERRWNIQFHLHSDDHLQ